ncbi:hypothetical protein Acsp02_92760 [Actinoplanes sp. NBRC 103695]|nr:hypothetical protein Acsp02_92760 [Actinoplanes sp. NBRC 103695]
MLVGGFARGRVVGDDFDQKGVVVAAQYQFAPVIGVLDVVNESRDHCNGITDPVRGEPAFKVSAGRPVDGKVPGAAGKRQPE